MRIVQGHRLPAMIVGSMLSERQRKRGVCTSACSSTEGREPGTRLRAIGCGLRTAARCALILAICGCGESAQNRAERAIADLVKDHNARMVVDEKLPNHPIVKLDFSDTKTYDSELAPLADLADLNELVLTGTKITDAAVDAFAQLPQLQTLTLTNDGITDASLAKLAKLPRLQCLGLGGTRITDAGVRCLEDCKTLQVLYLNRTEVSEAAAKSLRDALPQARIVR
jgi:hypothetical protein